MHLVSMTVVAVADRQQLESEQIVHQTEDGRRDPHP